MARGPDDEPTGGDPEEGPVLSPEELDISEDERVRQLDDGRYVVSSGDPIADDGPPDRPAGQVDAGADDRPELDGATGDERSRTRTAGESDVDRVPAEQPDPATDPAELDAEVVHEWLTEDLDAANSRYGFDITASFDGTVAQQRMVSNDVVAIFENLTTWYAQQIDRNTPAEEVLGILLTEANIPLQYPTAALERVVAEADLSPEDSIADLLAAVEENDGFQL